MTPEQPRTVVVAASQKSPILAAVLVILFGPLGLLYTSVLWSLILMVVYFVLSFITFGLFIPLALAANVIVAILAAIAVSGGNKAGLERIRKAIDR